MKKKLQACILDSSSSSSVYLPSIGQDESSLTPENVNRAKVKELLGIVGPQESLEIDDLLSRTHQSGECSAHNNKDDNICERDVSDNSLEAVGFPLPRQRTNPTCMDKNVSHHVKVHNAYVQPPVLKTTFIQELATPHWGLKLLRFKCLASHMSVMLDRTNWHAKSSQLHLQTEKRSTHTHIRQEGTFPLPPPSCPEKHYLPSPLKKKVSPKAHPLPQPPCLSSSFSNKQAQIQANYDKDDGILKRAASCDLQIGGSESKAQEVMPLPYSMANGLMHDRTPCASSVETQNQQFIVSMSYKSPSPLSSARLCPRPSYPTSTSELVPNSPSRSPTPKSLCPQKWRKGAVLGQGTFGIVHEGLNLEDGSFFAVKVSSTADVSPEIQQEVDVLSKLEHPNIVRYLGSSIEGGRVCIFIELVRMGSLEAILRKYKRFEDNTIRSYTRQILLGLEYLHAKKTIHRDIKCANILVDVNGQVKLSDFGVAKQVGETLASSLKGTPLYMAPEVLTPNKNCYSFSADIWSLGCTVLEMADGKPPWSNLEGFGFLFKVKKGELPPMPDHLSPEGKDFVCRCLNFHAKDRPTALELLQHPFVANVSSPEPLIPSAPPSPSPVLLPPSFPSLNSWTCLGRHLSASRSTQCTL